MIRVVFVNGVASHGKGEFVRAFCKIASEHGVCASPFSTIDTVKLAGRILGVEPEPKTDAKRLLWHRMKAAWTEYDDGPFVEAVTHVETLAAVPRHIACIDVREPAELQKFKDHFKKSCLCILVRNPRVSHVPDNAADQSVEHFEYDLIVNNSGELAALQRLALDLFNLIGCKNGYLPSKP